MTTVPLLRNSLRKRLVFLPSLFAETEAQPPSSSSHLHESEEMGPWLVQKSHHSLTWFKAQLSARRWSPAYSERGRSLEAKGSN